MDRQITLNDVSVKAKSKKEVYSVLTVEGGLYLPPIMDSSKEYLKAIMTGKEKFLSSKDVNVIKLPQLKSLSIKEILVFAKKNTDIENYLPIYKYNKLPNREWLWNVINFIGGSCLRNSFKMLWIKKRNDFKQRSKCNCFPRNSKYLCGVQEYLLR